jgi:hypothetical protein
VIPFRQYISERLEIQDNPNAYTPPASTAPQSRKVLLYSRRQTRLYGGVMARMAARDLARHQRERGARKPSRAPYQWDTSTNAGWWHPSKPWFTFGGEGEFHVTQIVNHPQRFGISPAELKKALTAEAEWLTSRRVLAYSRDGIIIDWTPELVAQRIKELYIDLAYHVQRLAYMKVWLKVYARKFSSNSPSPIIEGISRDSIKSALREVRDVVGSEPEAAIIEIGLVPRTEKNIFLENGYSQYLNS